MSVFLRWGIFGILGVAALIYAYNASKRLAEAHAQKSAAVPGVPAPAPDSARGSLIGDAQRRQPVAAPVQDSPISPRCAVELVVAQRALEARKQGQPLDRLLRIPEIAWEESTERRERLTKVATDWFNHEGDWGGGALRITVVSDCEQHPPAQAPQPGAMNR